MKQFTTGDAVTGFRHTAFSNFSPAPVTLDAREYPTVEHAYQAAKTLDPTEREWVRVARSPGEAKRRGRRVTMRPDWDAVKVEVMRDLLRQKFASGERLHELMATGNDLLMEGNNWHDEFWGVCSCPKHGRGLNWLGRLLMEIRAER
jgi:ribA/ribD-fused uncharacterized protein